MMSPALPLGPLFLSDLHVLLLEDLLVLLQRQDEKLVLKCHSKTALGSSDPKQSFSPVLKLNSVLIRSVATGKEGGAAGSKEDLALLLPPRPASLGRGRRGSKCHPDAFPSLSASPPSPRPDKRALFIICTSELGPQIYELVASTSSEKNT